MPSKFYLIITYKFRTTTTTSTTTEQSTESTSNDSEYELPYNHDEDDYELRPVVNNQPVYEKLVKGIQVPPPVQEQIKAQAPQRVQAQLPKGVDKPDEEQQR